MVDFPGFYVAGQKPPAGGTPAGTGETPAGGTKPTENPVSETSADNSATET